MPDCEGVLNLINLDKIGTKRSAIEYSTTMQNFVLIHELIEKLLQEELF